MYYLHLPLLPGDSSTGSNQAEVMLGAGDDAAVVDFLDGGRRISTVQTIDAWPGGPLGWDDSNGC